MNNYGNGRKKTLEMTINKLKVLENGTENTDCDSSSNEY